MRCAEAQPQSRIKTKISIWGGVGNDRTIDPQVTGDVTSQIYRIYHRCSNKKIFWVLSLRPIYSILCGDLPATMSQNSTTVYVQGRQGYVLLCMNHAGDTSHQQTATITAEAKETEGTAPVAKHEDTSRVHVIVEGCNKPTRKMNVAPPYFYMK